jgi:protein involved in polysaccharide export with SLBB domain
MLVEFVDNRLKTAEDVKRVTNLPLLTSLRDLRSMKPAERAQWAFRAWTMLQGRLSPSANFGLVCGITSSAPQEGRSTVINLLAEAASMTGFRVLTIATKPSPTQAQSNDEIDEMLEDVRAGGQENGHSNHSTNSLTTSVLTSPAQVADQLTGPNSQPVVHIPLPGWVWNLERRKQWREALDQWRRIDNLVILVELPPASLPEAVLLGSNLPNMVWLADSGKADAAETRAQLETLHHARCNLVGAVLNHQPRAQVRKLFPRWLSGLALLATVGLAHGAIQDAKTQRPENEPSPAELGDDTRTNLAFSIVRPSQRAAWQQHLTLGPGDVLTFNLYGQPELVRTEVAIGPDGRVSYLEAQDVPASGLTVDELRAKMDEELGKYRRAPRTMITPIAFHSKKYYMLGKIAMKGVFTLDRPLTVLEAIARAHGLETALVDRNLVSLADFQRSFVARGGKRIPLNFEKLFQQGDLSQNIAVEPSDYIYFAPGDVNEVYVVGEIRLPGPVTFRPDLTIIQAITDRGGYTDRAFKTRVVVVRGSLNKPLTFAVNTHAILDAQAQDFKLEPKDIIYVNSRPFIKVEELADLAATAFIQSVITSWVGVDVVKPIQ